MKSIPIIKRIAKGYLYLVGALFILLAFDCFGSVGCPECNSFWDNLLCFLISISPGVVIILVNYFLRKKERVLGGLFIILSIVAFFLLKFYRDFAEKIPTFIIIVVLPLVIGILFISYTSNKD